MKQYLYLDEWGNAALVRQQPDQGRLQMFQRLVDGYIDIAASAPTGQAGFPVDAIVNDEGRYRQDFGINLTASLLTGRQLVGPVVLSTVTADGESVGLDKAQLRRICRHGLTIDDNGGEGYTADQIASERFGR